MHMHIKIGKKAFDNPKKAFIFTATIYRKIVPKIHSAARKKYLKATMFSKLVK